MSLIPQKSYIKEEQVQSGSIISEAGERKIGRTLNFHNQRNLKNFIWKLNGKYKDAQGDFVDGVLTSPFSFSVCSLSIYMKKQGISGSTVFDIQKIGTDGENDGSIFSTKPVINHGVGDYFHYMLRLDDDSELVGGGKISKPVLSVKDFLAGEGLILKLESGLLLSDDLSVTLHYREENDVNL